jgi:6-phosphogluconate dehydrogenase
MVHNGIEYGAMAAYAEGFAILRKANAGKADQVHDAETAPLTHPEYYQYDLDTTAIAELWRRGSVVASWLLDLTAIALHEDPDLDEFGGKVSDSGEGRWTIQAAVDTGVPAHVLTASLYERSNGGSSANFGCDDRVGTHSSCSGHLGRRHHRRTLSW